MGHHEGYKTFDDICGLMATHTVYKSIQRPIGDSDNGNDIYIYMSSPTYTYKYIPDMVCLSKRVPPPSGAIFACYVKISDGKKKGHILSWEWITKDHNSLCPEDENSRYGETIWRKSNV